MVVRARSSLRVWRRFPPARDTPSQIGSVADSAPPDIALSLPQAVGSLDGGAGER